MTLKYELFLKIIVGRAYVRLAGTETSTLLTY